MQRALTPGGRASVVPLMLLALLARPNVRVAAWASRGLMSSGVPPGVKPPYRVALIGDFLSWDSADYKLAEALDTSLAVEETLYLQLDEIEIDLLSLQLRSFDPNTVLVSIRARAFEHILQLVLSVVRKECRQGDRIVVIAFHLQAHAIRAAQRAFARVSSTEAGDSSHEDRYALRAAAYCETYGVELEPLPLMMDDWGPIVTDDIQEGGLMPVWFGPSVPERWCQQLSESETCVASKDPLYDIVVLGTGASGVAVHVQQRYGAQHRVLVLQGTNATAAIAHLSRARAPRQNNQCPQQQQQQLDYPPEPKPEDLLASARVFIVTQPGRAEEKGFSAVQHTVEALVLGGVHLIHETSAQGYDGDQVAGMSWLPCVQCVTQ